MGLNPIAEYEQAAARMEAAHEALRAVPDPGVGLFFLPWPCPEYDAFMAACTELGKARRALPCDVVDPGDLDIPAVSGAPVSISIVEVRSGLTAEYIDWVRYPLHARPTP